MHRNVRVRGRGRVLVSAYGVADAEHLVEKELARLWSEGAVLIEGVSRVGPPRIVEEFAVTYRIEAVVTVDSRQGKEGELFRVLRRQLEGSRYRRTEWEIVEGDGENSSRT